MTLLLHSLGANYNQFARLRNQSQFGERGPRLDRDHARGPRARTAGTTATRAPTPSRSGPTSPAATTSIRRWTAISGYSMGGYGTYKFATQYPDLFARANPVVGPPGLGIWVPPARPQPGGAASNTNRMLGSVRNIPFLIWNGAEDELVPGRRPGRAGPDLRRARLPLPRSTCSRATDHFALAVNDQYAPVADFLGTHEVDRNPAHVTYVVNPTMDFPSVGTVADHAYWLSGLKLRDSGGNAPLGRVDARSEAFGLGDPDDNPTQTRARDASGRQLRPPGLRRAVEELGAGAADDARNVLHLDAENLAQVVVHPGRARLTCRPQLDVTTDGPLTLTLAGCGRTLHFGGP